MSLIEKAVPKYGLVLEFDTKGTVVKSYHDPTGRTPFVSEAHRSKSSGFLFLGSHSNAFLARVSS
ncbi:unnamed protein product [Chrysoparadoxa australica]